MVLGFHRNDPVESVGAVERGTGALDQIHFQHVEVAGTEKVAQRKVESGRLVVHAVDNLQRADGAGRVESPRIDDGEAERGGGQVDAFQVAEAVVKTDGGSFLDGNGVEVFDGERCGFLFVVDSLAFYDRFGDDNRTGGQFYHDPLVALGDLNFLRGVAGIGESERDRQGFHFQGEFAVVVSDRAAVSADQRHRRAYQIFPRIAVQHLPAQGYLRIGGDASEDDPQKTENQNFVELLHTGVRLFFRKNYLKRCDL